jgi:hypothetical protein
MAWLKRKYALLIYAEVDKWVKDEFSGDTLQEFVTSHLEDYDEEEGREAD